jgi:uncharacterized protein YegL
MSTLKLFTGALMVASVAWWRGWTTPFHFAIGAAALGLGFLAAVLWRRSRQEDGEGPKEGDDAEGVSDNPFRALVFGAVGGLVVAAGLALVFGIAGAIDPIARIFCDGDRKAFEARLEPLAQAGQHDEVVARIRNRLAAGRVSRAWRADLIRQQGESLIEAAIGAKTRPDRLRRLESAVAFAQANGLDTRRGSVLRERERERHKLEAEFDRLRSARAWSQLIPNLRLEIAKADRSAWVIPADRWLSDACLAWARESTNLTERQEKIGWALDVAREFKLDPGPAQALRDTTAREVALDRQVQRAHDEGAAAARNAAQTEIAGLKRQQLETDAARKQDQVAAAAALEHQRTDAAARLKRAAAEARCRALIDAGDAAQGPASQPALEHQIRLYTEALGVARAGGLDPQPAAQQLDRTRAALADLRARIERDTRPADLPRGSTLRILRVGTDRFPPALDLAVAVDDGRGRAVTGLTAKDFRITCAGLALTNLILAPVQDQPPPLEVVVAMDCSASVAGPALASSIAGAQSMIGSLESERPVHVKVLAFRDTVEVRCDWTTDLDKAARSVAGLAADGRTALYAAVQLAANDLEPRPGDRRLVVFTDGKDTQAGPGDHLPASIARLRRAGVTVAAIGLQTRDLDRPTVERLAANTGGTYHHAAAPAEIAARFLEARRQLRREYYRFVLTPALVRGTPNFDLRVEAGGTNPILAQTSGQFPTGLAVAGR